MNPTPHSTSAFPYTVPYTNPYTQRKTQPSSSFPSSSQSSPQQELNQALKVLARSSNVPSTQNIEQLFELVRRSNEYHAADDSQRQRQQQQQQQNGQQQHQSASSSCWTLGMAESLATFVVRIFGCHENINMTGRNPEGYPSTLCFLARSLEEWFHDDSIMYAVSVKELEVEIEQYSPNNNHHHQTRTIQQSLLQVLHNLVVHFRDPIVQNPAMAGLSTIWRYLDRVQCLTSWNPTDLTSFSLDAAWWMPVVQEDESALASLALAELLTEDKEDNFPKVYIFPSRAELRTASTSLLLCFLKHDRTSWLQQLSLQNKESLRKLSQNLLEGVHRLADPSLTSSDVLHQSIASASLFCLIDSKEETLEHSNEFNQLVYSTKLLDNVFRSCFGIFGASSPSGPRWSFENKDVGTLRWMEEFVYSWSLSKDGATRKLGLDGVERHWKSHMEQCWISLLSEDYSKPGEWNRNLKQCQEIFSRLALMNAVHHSSLRGLLCNTLTQAAKNNGSQSTTNFLVKPSRRLLQSLQHLSLHPDLGVATCAASLMKSLLGGRSSVITHDEMSRSIWNAIDLEFVQTCIQSILQLSKSSKTDQSARPLLLSLLDVLDLTLSSETLLHEVIHVVDTESLEVLIHLMTPKDIRIDQAGTFMNNTSLDSTGMEDSDTDTPPANNLSRLDEKSICIEKEEEEKAVTGIDRCIRIAVATVLSRFGYLDISNLPIQHDNSRTGGIRQANAHSLRLIQSRIRATVTDFFSASATEPCDDQFQSTPPSSFNALHSASMELTRRRFRLLVSMAVPENEEFLSSYIFSKDKSHENLVVILKENVSACKKELEMAAQKEVNLTKEKEDCRKKIDAQSVRFWREVQRVKKTNTEETKSKVGVFDAERKVAERRAHDISKQLREAENRAREADDSAKTSHEGEARARVELNEISTQVATLGEHNEDLKRQMGQRDAVIGDMKEKVANMDEDQKRLEHILADKENIISNLEEGRDGMEAHLNNLFSDLVTLSNMFEIQEQQGKDLLDKNGSISKELQEERRQKGETEQRFRIENQQLKDEKEKLEKKLVKYKEKLENYKEKLENDRRERKEVEQRQKSRAPVSYLNSLHDSRDTSMHARKPVRPSESQQRKGSNSQARIVKRDKENDYMRESQRGSKYRDESQRRPKTRDEGYSSSSSFRPLAYR